jgi:tetratricopeptide (TPR) repeat protein
VQNMKRISITVLLVLAALHTQTAQGQNDLTRLVRQIRASIVTVIAFNGDGKPIGQGTGFFVGTKGELITNYHVLAGAQNASVKTRSGRMYDITETLAEDRDGDLIEVRVDIPVSNAPPLVIANVPVVAGQRAIVIGSPLGLDQTVSEGIVSAVRQIPGMGRVIQITAPLSHGSSGSPVVNSKGQVIGVASSSLAEGQNLNFAISSERINALIARYLQSSPKSPATARSRTRRTRQTSSSKTRNQSENDMPTFDKFLADILEEERKSIPTLEQRVAKNSRDLDALEKLGIAYSNNQQFIKAVDVYKKALLVEPNNVSIHTQLCDVYLNLEEYSQALIHCDKALSLKPSNVNALTGKGGALMGLGRNDEAIILLKEAIAEDPQATYAHEKLGYIYMNMGRYEEAAKAFEFMASIANHFAPSFTNIAWAYENLGRDEEAELNYKKAIQIDDKFDAAYMGLAALYDRMGKTTDAIAQYKQAIKVNANNGDAYLNLGLLYLSTGDKKSTLDTYNALKKIDPVKARLLSSSLYQ